jgi:signal transduction histidine kinase
VHDDSIQAMVAVGMRLQLLADRLPDEHRQAVRQLDESVRGAVGRLRELIFRLRPPTIDSDGGLAEAISAYFTDVVTGWGLTCSLRYELAPGQELPAENAVTVFRICQEALANVRKHAEANFVEIVVRPVHPGVLVQVIDDGIGVSTDISERADHFGVIEMRERAETAGGWWAMRPGTSGGTVVEFWLPVAPR